MAQMWGPYINTTSTGQNVFAAPPATSTSRKSSTRKNPFTAAPLAPATRTQGPYTQAQIQQNNAQATTLGKLYPEEPKLAQFQSTAARGGPVKSQETTPAEAEVRVRDFESRRTSKADRLKGKRGKHVNALLAQRASIAAAAGQKNPYTPTEGFVNPSTGSFQLPNVNPAEKQWQISKETKEEANKKGLRQEATNARAAFMKEHPGAAMGAPDENAKPKRQVLSTGAGGTDAQGKALKKFKKPKFKLKESSRMMTEKEFNALPKDQQNMIRFNTRLQDLRAANDTYGLASLEQKLGLSGVSRDEFRAGIAAITDEDLFGKGRSKPVPKSAKTPFFQRWDESPGPRATPVLPPRQATQNEDVVRERIYGGVNRERLVAQISTAVNKMFAAEDQYKAMQAKANKGKVHETMAAAQKAVNPVPVGLGASLGFAPDKEQAVLEIMQNTAKPSLWKQKGVGMNTVQEAVKGAGLTLQEFAQYAGSVAVHRYENKLPLSGDAKDTFDYNDYIKKLGIREG